MSTSITTASDLFTRVTRLHGRRPIRPPLRSAPAPQEGLPAPAQAQAQDIFQAALALTKTTRKSLLENNFEETTKQKLASLDIMGTQLIVPLNPLEHHSTMVPRGLRWLKCFQFGCDEDESMLVWHSFIRR